MPQKSARLIDNHQESFLNFQEVHFLLGRHPIQMVLDARHAEPTAYRLYRCPWDPQGYRAELVPLVQDKCLLKQQLAEAQELIVLKGPLGIGKELAHVLTSLSGVRIIDEETSSILCEKGIAIPLDHISAELGYAQIQVEGMVSATFQVTFPWTFHIALSANPNLNVIGICALTEHLPAAASWFQVLTTSHTARKVPLVLDIAPSLQGFRWSLQGDTGTTIRQVTAPPLYAASRSLSHLGILLDRTCCDWDKTLLNAVPDSEPGSWNQQIRQGLIRGIQSTLPSTTAIHLAWFANELGDADHDTPLKSNGSAPGPANPEAAAAILNTWGHLPGLDFWDDLGGGLAQLSPDVRFVLIIGNSPPEVPARRDNPFWALLESTNTSVRRISSLFDQKLEDFQQRRIPLVYLFLYQNHARPACWPQFEQFQSLQAQVERTFRELMPVIVAPASEDGVQQGVIKALDILTKPLISGVFMYG